MATRKGLEPSTSNVTGWRSNQLSYRAIIQYELGGNNRARTCDPLLVRQMLSQLSYAPGHHHQCGIGWQPCGYRGDLYIIAHGGQFVKRFFDFPENFSSSGLTDAVLSDIV